MRHRFWQVAGSALFVFYCTAVGVFLILKPWTGLARPQFGVGGSFFFRGFVSGLGLLHLVAAVADLKSLSHALSAEPAPSPAQQETAP
jgi:hypothetical protein